MTNGFIWKMNTFNEITHGGKTQRLLRPLGALVLLLFL